MTYPNKATLTEAELLEANYRKYEGETIDVFYNQTTCKHATECVRGNPAVFEYGRRPWIIVDNGSTEKNMEVINRCPTGALKYILKEEH